MLGQVASRQQAAMHLGMQGLDTAIEHFGKTGERGHLGHRQAALGQQLGGAARRDQFDAQRMQRAREFKDAGFVGDGEECVHGVWIGEVLPARTAVLAT